MVVRACATTKCWGIGKEIKSLNLEESNKEEDQIKFRGKVRNKMKNLNLLVKMVDNRNDWRRNIHVEDH